MGSTTEDGQAGIGICINIRVGAVAVPSSRAGSAAADSRRVRARAGSLPLSRPHPLARSRYTPLANAARSSALNRRRLLAAATAVAVAVTVASVQLWLPYVHAPAAATGPATATTAAVAAAPTYSPNYSIPWVQELQAGIRSAGREVKAARAAGGP